MSAERTFLRGRSERGLWCWHEEGDLVSWLVSLGFERVAWRGRQGGRVREKGGDKGEKEEVSVLFDSRCYEADK